MKYKVGDKVRIKSKEWFDNIYGDDAWCKYVNGVPFNMEMAEYCGQLATISHCNGSYYDISIDGNRWAWTDSMFEDKAEQSFEIYDGDAKVTYQSTDTINQKVVDKIIAWCKEHNCSCGETLFQNDECMIYAPELLAEIIDDILKFETKFEE